MGGRRLLLGVAVAAVLGGCTAGATPTPVTAPAIDPSWTPSPGVFPRDAAVAWCQLVVDMDIWLVTWMDFANDVSEPPDLATVRATIPGILVEERPAAEAVRADLAALETYSTTAEWARAVGTGVDAIEAKLEEFDAATEATDLAALTDSYNGVIDPVGYLWGMGGASMPGKPENCPGDAASPAEPTAQPTQAAWGTPRPSVEIVQLTTWPPDDVAAFTAQMCSGTSWVASTQYLAWESCEAAMVEFSGWELEEFQRTWAICEYPDGGGDLVPVQDEDPIADADLSCSNGGNIPQYRVLRIFQIR